MPNMLTKMFEERYLKERLVPNILRETLEEPGITGFTLISSSPSLTFWAPNFCLPDDSQLLAERPQVFSPPILVHILEESVWECDITEGLLEECLCGGVTRAWLGPGLGDTR